MLVEHFAAVLWVTGAITAAPVLQFFAPKQVLALLYRIELTDEAGLLSPATGASSPPPSAASSCSPPPIRSSGPQS
jgi:hypothetical protein